MEIQTKSKILNMVFKAIVLGAILFFSYLMLQITFPYLVPPFPTDIDFLFTKQHVLHLDWWRWSFYLHISTSVFVLLAGLTQFSKYVLKQYPKLHRNIGKLYVFIILIVSGPAGLVMSFYANAGMVAQVGFFCLAMGWWIFTYLAYHYIRKGDLKRHGVFMFRSYALTLSAVTLRLLIMLSSFLPYELDYAMVYQGVAWLSWIINLSITEVLIYNGIVERYFRKLKVI